MKKILSFFIVSFVLLFSLSAEQKYFQIKGPERSYNQIRVVNETSYEDFMCRISVLTKTKSGELKKKSTYGVYSLKEKGDADSCTDGIKRNSYIGIELESDFPSEVSFEVEYKDMPFFDVIVIHLYDAKDDGVSPKFQDDFDYE